MLLLSQVLGHLFPVDNSPRTFAPGQLPLWTFAPQTICAPGHLKKKSENLKKLPRRVRNVQKVPRRVSAVNRGLGFVQKTLMSKKRLSFSHFVRFFLCSKLSETCNVECKDKCPGGQIAWGVFCLGGKYPGSKRPGGKYPGATVWGANVLESLSY